MATPCYDADRRPTDDCTSQSQCTTRRQDALAEQGFSNRVIELPESTRTLVEAAAAVGCEVRQIAKSLIFQGTISHKPILVIASGDNRVNEKAMAVHAGEKMQRPDAEFVRLHTGFAIGGVPPLGHDQPLLTYIDADLWRYESDLGGGRRSQRRLCADTG